MSFVVSSCVDTKPKTPTTPNRVGQVNGAGDVNALFLKVYAGEVPTAWDEANVMKDLHMVRTTSSGKSASFPAGDLKRPLPPTMWRAPS